MSIPSWPRAALLAVVLCLLLLSELTNLNVEAHSNAWSTLTRAEHVQGIQHDILPRTSSSTSSSSSSSSLIPSTSKVGSQSTLISKRAFDSSNRDTLEQTNIVRRDDTIRLQLSAFNRTFVLHLEPNNDLIHPDSKARLDVDEIKAFKGFVVDSAYSDQKWEAAHKTSPRERRSLEHMLYEEGVLGWARMTVEHDKGNDDALVLRGAFVVNDVTYHVSPTTTYHIQKRADDAMPFGTIEGSNLVIYRDSDLLANKLARRGNSPQEAHNCGSSNLLNQTRAYQEALAHNNHYYAPDLSQPISALPHEGDWTDMLRAPGFKRAIQIRAAAPNPVPTGCPVNRLVNYMGVAADCTYVRNYGGSSQARAQIFADFNTASAIYESTFNVALGIIELAIMSENCPTTVDPAAKWNQDCSVPYSIDKRLSDFSFWRGQDTRSSDGAGLWHLMTKCNSGAVVGIAWTKVLCQSKTQAQGTQFTSGTGVSSITLNEWMVVSHEVGHGFGAIHDCTASACATPGCTATDCSAGDCCPLSSTTCNANGQFIMNPSEQQASKQFSPCSISAICGTIHSSLGQCLQPPGTRSTQASAVGICGNGLKEPGEDCDCGSADDCAKDPCCDGTTCKFKAGAVCDDLNEDCCLNCQLRPAGTVCRKSTGECDVQEVCSGTNATCPTDIHIPDLTPCGASGNMTGLQCADGVCTSRSLQCLQQGRTGVTGQCSAGTSKCDLLCNDPSGDPMSCLSLPGVYFIDGTTCGVGGTCSSGQCVYSGALGGVLSWAKDHLAIVIPVGCLLGIFVLWVLWSCFSSCCRRAQRRQVSSKPQRIRSTASRTDGYVQHVPQSQQYPMGSIPLAPPPVYYDPGRLQREHDNATAAQREEEDLQRAMEASQREHQAQMTQSQMSMGPAPEYQQQAPPVQPSPTVSRRTAPSPPMSYQNQNQNPFEGYTPPNDYPGNSNNSYAAYSSNNSNIYNNNNSNNGSYAPSPASYNSQVPSLSQPGAAATGQQRYNPNYF